MTEKNGFQFLIISQAEIGCEKFSELLEDLAYYIIS